MTAPRTIFVNRFYWPEHPATGQLLADLAEELAARGETVIVVTSGPATSPADEVHAGVIIRRLRRAAGSDRGRWAKLRAWLGFTAGVVWELSRIVRRGDRLVLLTDPPLLPLLAGPIARRRGAAVFHWVQDVYPELPERLLGWRGLGPLRSLRNREWRLAAGLAVLGADMDFRVRTSGVDPRRIHRIANWAPRGLAPATPSRIDRRRMKWDLAGKFVIMYSGNFGRVHALEPILELATQLRAEPGCVFLFVGGGAQETRLRMMVAERRLPNVRFEPPQPREELAVTLGAGDLHFVTLADGCADLVFPSKYYGILAVGRPIIYIGPAHAELAQAIAGHGIGGVFAPTDIAAMAALVRTWHRHPELPRAMGRHALALHQASPGPAGAADHWISLLKEPASPQIGADLPALSP